jgi:hypothetical protein
MTRPSAELMKALTKVHDAATELLRHTEASDADG